MLVAFLASGCGAVGRVTSGDPSQGKALFLTNCAGCHTLADAKSTGTIGPNLDDAFSSDKQQGFSRADDEGRRPRPDRLPRSGRPMPANIVTGSDANTSRPTSRSAPATRTAASLRSAAEHDHDATTATTTTAGTTTSAATTTTGGARRASAAELAEGKQIFLVKAGCGGCHTLKDAGSTGNGRAEPRPAEAVDDKTVEHQVENGGGPMPAFKGTLTRGPDRGRRGVRLQRRRQVARSR